MSDELRMSMNVVSEVVQNRPLPLREFDQIYMKMGDLTVHSHYVSSRFAGRDVVFVGDGDAVALSIANLLHNGITTPEKAPKHITVLDFDERICHSINDFARRADFSSYINAELYNVIDPIADKHVSSFDAFHINPPYGQYNSARSVIAFMRRGLSCIKQGGLACCIAADHRGFPWTKEILQIFQLDCLESGCVIEEIVPEFHSYHLEDAVKLKSCTILARLLDEKRVPLNVRLSDSMLINFYGRDQDLKVRYVERTPLINESAAPSGTYNMKLL